jgi:hypothetical protein
VRRASSFIESLRHFRAFALLAAFAGLFASVGCHGAPTSFLVELDEVRQTAADLRAEFNRATDASNRAVMADTDESSVAFANEAKVTAQRVENDRAALGSLLRHLNYGKELEALADFGHHFDDYRKLDAEILALAVENTNLKAQKLAFGPAREAADAFRAALESFAPAATTKDRCRVEEIVSRAVLAVREIQVLQAPHIAEADDAAMTRLESEMAARKATARAALGELSGLSAASSRASLTDATAALDRFDSIGAQIVALSRQNTNVRSLDLALRAKPPLTAACDDSLRALQDALAKEGSMGTR